MKSLSFKLEVFEGPLDLLIFLIQKNKLDIYDIPISQLLEQYFDYLEQMKTMDLEIASEFLEMAARLVYIKSMMLLPNNEELEAAKRELTGELLEYEACKRAAAFLAESQRNIDRFVKKQDRIEPDNKYTLSHNIEQLYNAYIAAIGRGKRKLPPPVTAFSNIVTGRIVSVSSMILRLLRRFMTDEYIPYEEVFDQATDRCEIVATFLALLELIKSGRIKLDEHLLILNRTKTLSRV